MSTNSASALLAIEQRIDELVLFDSNSVDLSGIEAKYGRPTIVVRGVGIRQTDALIEVCRSSIKTEMAELQTERARLLLELSREMAG